jgi:hypothetical protein
MIENTDLLIFWVVVAVRFFVPLTIIRYPLPGIVVSLILDNIDYAIFTEFTNIPMERYQGFDKALDIYYLTIAYISTMRNWKNLYTFKLSKFLFYYRLFGATLFEMTQLRPLLMIFPNTFEYFFIFYEALRLKFDPEKLTHWQWIGIVAAIWIFIKLPQEYLIHIAQVDFVEWIKDNTMTLVALVAIIVIIVLVVAFILLKKYPPSKWGLTNDTDTSQKDPARGKGGS